MGAIEFGTCEICGKETALERTYFKYNINCECHYPHHFVVVCHCKDCVPEIPEEIYPIVKDMLGKEYKANVTGLLPIEITGNYQKDNIIYLESKQLLNYFTENGKYEKMKIVVNENNPIKY